MFKKGNEKDKNLNGCVKCLRKNDMKPKIGKIRDIYSLWQRIH